jgi:hypothetical protein
MNGHARERDSADAVALVLKEQAGGERYRRRQQQVRRVRRETEDRPRPLEFDENGFPVPQHTPRFLTRVARLLSQS